MCQIYILHAPIAQLDRASGFGPEGWGFESSWAHDKPPACIGSNHPKRTVNH